ncbi:MAG: hypothetical protein ACI9X4_001036 [Glaciecola sp.]|jgi:hypothetical protein
MLNMNLKNKKTALQSLLASSALIAIGTLSAWAGDGGWDDLSAGGDTVGTLPSTAGGNSIVLGQDTGNLDADQGVARTGTNFYITLPEVGLRRSVESATGAGYVLVVPLGAGMVRAEFHGDMTLVLNEGILRALDAEMGLVSEGRAPVLIGLEIDSLSARSAVVAAGQATELPILSLMNSGKNGTQILVVESFQAPYQPNRVSISRGAGVLILTQGPF